MTDLLNVNKLQDQDKRQKISSSQSQSQSSQEDEFIMCQICCEAWTTRGPHSLVSLKCGHLFGKSCITRWITERTQKIGAKKTGCPNCSKVAKINELRPVLPIKLAVKDTSEIDKLRRELEQKRLRIVQLQTDIDRMRLAIQLRKNQMEKLKRQADGEV